MTQFFAAYDDASIYAIGTSADEAIATARAETQDPDAPFQAARISTALAAYIETHGWDLSRRFAVVGGYLVDTTRVDDDAALVVCESEDGWSLHAPDSTDDKISEGAALPLASGTGQPTREDYDLARAQLDSPARASTWALRRFAVASGITPTELSRVLGRDDRTMRRWLAGEQDVPDTLAQQVERIQVTGVTSDTVHLMYRR